MRFLFRATRCTFSLECRERQILRGLGLMAVATLLFAAHLQEIGKFPTTNFFTDWFPVTASSQKISAYLPQTVPVVSSNVTPNKPKTSVLKLPAHWSIESGSVNGSFTRSLQKAGLTKSEISSLTQILAQKIDFKHLHHGDHFKIITERIPSVTPHQASTDHIIAVKIFSGTQTTMAIRYADSKGHVNYYQADGSSLSPGFLRYPAHYTRIGSGFMLHRLDPITGEYHSHPAIDFDAPIGTPITATAEGKITTIGYEQGYGNVIKINHAGHIMTLYAHMRNFVKGLSRGNTVKKGQVIGYVGMSGYATGPHVHYELHLGSKPVNPLTASLPAGSGISKQQKSSFNQIVKQVMPLIG